MSGGRWKYEQSILRNVLEAVSEDEDVASRFPHLSELFLQLSEVLYDTINTLDYDVCSDSKIKNDTNFEFETIGKLLELTMKAAPDALFLRGKWATIQALQGIMAMTLEAKENDQHGSRDL